MSLAIGVEIGGTKLQAGIGLKNDRLLALARTIIDPDAGAEGILSQIPELIDSALADAGCKISAISGIGVGFGGPVDSDAGLTLTSHQVEGWNQYPLQQWFEDRYGVKTRIENDAGIAALAEARLGAGKGRRRVFYLTIGSGIGGGWVVDGVLDPGQGLGCAEIGHVWVPDPDDGEPEKLEHIASGWSIGARAQEALEYGETSALRQICNGDLGRIDAKMVYQAAEENDLLSQAILDEAAGALGLAIGNAVTLLHPDIVILGGGVSLMGERFWSPLKQSLKRFTFPLYQDRTELAQAALGEDVVVVGAALVGLGAGEAD